MRLGRSPQHLEDLKKEYKLPDFWIAKYPNPDTLLLSFEEIALLNKQIMQKCPVSNPLLLERYPKDDIRIKIVETAPRIKDTWFLDGEMIDDKKKQHLWENCAIEEVREFKGELYGVTVTRTHIRALPTDSILSEEREDVDFDLLQLSTIDPITPLAILHFSADGDWAFCLSTFYYGWVRVKDIAFETHRSLLWSLFQESEFAVVTANRFDVSWEEHTITFQMGTLLPYSWSKGNDLFIKVPVRAYGGHLTWSEAVVRNYDNKVSKGYLPYTLSNVYLQAFKMLGEPYAWGGSRQGASGRDCSRFVQDVFKVFGIFLPRDSGPQCGCMKTCIEFPKNMPYRVRYVKLLKANERPLLLCMPGHIMLYLGENEGNHYAIHALWAYSYPGGLGTEDEIEIVNEVVVTSLKIGYGSRKGSFLERLVAAKSIAL